MDIGFVIQSLLLGAGLSMDAFSISIANGLREPDMSGSRMSLMAGVYGFFQFLMPVVGWWCVRKAAASFRAFQKTIPWIALLLLVLIGGKMLLEGIGAMGKKGGKGASKQRAADAMQAPASPGNPPRLGFGVLLAQGFATAMDALSVGFTIAAYPPVSAFVCAVLIALVTFLICMAGLLFGKRFGMKLADSATIFGGLILIAVGLRIFFC